MNLQIDQIAICPPDPSAAIELLTAMGATSWINDKVTARGNVRSKQDVVSVGSLAYNYELGSPREFEVLHYERGPNWMQDNPASVSHFGMHCTQEQLECWRSFFAKRNIKVAQELHTEKHTNVAIAGKRRYHYVIFDTRSILGVDLKFIVRYVIDSGAEYQLPLPAIPL